MEKIGYTWPASVNGTPPPQLFALAARKGYRRQMLHGTHVGGGEVLVVLVEEI